MMSDHNDDDKAEADPCAHEQWLYKPEQEDEQPTVTTSDFPEFAGAIRNRVLYHLADVVEDQDYLNQFSEQFALRIDAMLQKYWAGQIEHGGDIRDRDITREETNAILDLFIYNLIRTTLQGLKAEIKI